MIIPAAIGFAVLLVVMIVVFVIMTIRQYKRIQER